MTVLDRRFVLGVDRHLRQPGSKPKLVSPPEILPAALWFGLIAGLLDLFERAFGWVFLGRITYDTLRTNWHFAWMIPLSNVLLFGAAGCILGVLAAVLPSARIRRVALVFYVLLIGFAMALSVPGVHRLSRACLAIGFAGMVGPWILKREQALAALISRTFLPAAALLSAFAIWSYWTVAWEEQRTLAALKPAAPGSPNVLLIVLDTVRADALTPYGAGSDTTPNLARLAARGVRFDHARSTAPWTLPAHASLFTGRWHHEHSANVGIPLGEKHLTLAESLSRRGYATAGFVANNENCNAWYGLNRGFAHYEDFYENTKVTPVELLRSSRLGRYVTTSKTGRHLLQLATTVPKYRYRKSAEMINRDALAWLSRQSNGPFFLFLNYFDVHDPYVLPEGVRKVVRDDEQCETLSVSERARNAYDDCLRYLDEQIGRLLGELERRGVLENTLVVVTSDHGEGFGEHNLSGHGISLYRQELHIPLLMALPSRVPEGVVVPVPVSLRDIAPTIASLTAAGSDEFPGTSLDRWWNAEDLHRLTPHPPVLSEVDRAARVPPEMSHAPARRGRMRSLVADGWIYIRNGDHREELYDLHSDPEEEHNLVDSPEAQDDLMRLREMLDGTASEVVVDAS